MKSGLDSRVMRGIKHTVRLWGSLDRAYQRYKQHKDRYVAKETKIKMPTRVQVKYAPSQLIWAVRVMCMPTMIEMIS